MLKHNLPVLRAVVKIGKNTYILDVMPELEQVSGTTIIGIIKNTHETIVDNNIPTLFYKDTRISLPLNDVLVVESTDISDIDDEISICWYGGTYVARDSNGELIVNLDTESEGGIAIKCVNEATYLEIEGEKTRFKKYSYKKMISSTNVVKKQRSLFQRESVDDVIVNEVVKYIFIPYGEPAYINTSFKYLNEDDL